MMTGILGHFALVRSSKVIPCGLFNKSHSVRSNRSPAFSRASASRPEATPAIVACRSQDEGNEFTHGLCIVHDEECALAVFAVLECHPLAGFQPLLCSRALLLTPRML